MRRHAEANRPHELERGHTLATGRPGSRHPVAEAQEEVGTRGIRPQSDSVVRSPNPHADTKLSSAKGTTQEREKEDLAEGKPGPDRPLSEASDDDDDD